MARKADPILVRSGINRLWWVNLKQKTSPASYHYLMERLDRSLKSMNAMLLDLRTFYIRSYNKYIIQALIFKFFSPRFKARVRMAIYQIVLNTLYFDILWRRWYRKKNLFSMTKRKLKHKGSKPLVQNVRIKIRNYFQDLFFYNFWKPFCKSFDKKKRFYETTSLRLFLQRYLYHNATGWFVDPLERFGTEYRYLDHPKVFFLAAPAKKRKPAISTSKKDVKWAKNLKRLMQLCVKFYKLDFTYILARFIAKEMEKDKRHWPFIKAIKKALKFSERDTELRGIKIRFVGKLKGARRSRIHDITSKWPTIPFQSFKNSIYVSSSTAHTVYGSVGVKVMVWRS